MKRLLPLLALLLPPTIQATEPVLVEPLLVPTYSGQALVIHNHIPIAPQANTVLTYGQPTQYSHNGFVPLNANEYLLSARDLARATNETTQLAIKAFGDGGSVVFNHQASIAAQNSRGDAAVRVLQAAGLSGHQAHAAGTCVTLRLTQTADGRVQVQVVPDTSAPKAAPKAGSSIALAPKAPNPAPKAEPQLTLVSSKCAACHSAGHKSGIFLDGTIDFVTFARSADAIRLGRMPPPDSGELTATEKGAIFEELLETLKVSNPDQFPAK